jgi:hypothetical protein
MMSAWALAGLTTAKPHSISPTAAMMRVLVIAE